MIIISPYNQYLSGLDSDAATYISAVEAADGQALESTTKKAINDFVVGCKADGIWDAIETGCLLIAAKTLDGCLVPLKGNAPTNIGFVSSDYNRKTGLKGDGSSKRLISNWTPLNYADVYAYINHSEPDTKFGLQSRVMGTSANSGNFFCYFTPSNTIQVSGGTSLFQVGVPRVESSAFAINRLGGGVFPDTFGIFSVGNVNADNSDARVPVYILGSTLDSEALNNRVTQLITDINNAF